MKPIKITKIEILQVKWELKDISPSEDTQGRPVYNPGNNLVGGTFLTNIYTDVGVIGTYPLSVDISGIAPYIIGKNPLLREEIFNEFNLFHLHGQNGGLDIVLWDILGKLTDLSVSELLGGNRKKLPAYASTMNGGIEGIKGGLSTPESYADFAQHCLEIGYKGFKIHPFPRPNVQEHVDLIHAVSERVGGKMDLMLDSFNYFSTLADALKVGRACDEAGFYWIEDLYYLGGGTSNPAHERLREFLDTPLLQGEKVEGIPGKVNMLVSGATDFIRGNVPSDGITGTMKLAAVAESMGTDIEIHGIGPAQRHVMGALGNSNYYEMVWVHPDTECLQMSPEIFGDNYSDGLDKVDSNGMVDVPSGPGMGVDWNWDAIKRMSTGTKIY